MQLIRLETNREHSDSTVGGSKDMPDTQHPRESFAQGEKL